MYVQDPEEGLPQKMGLVPSYTTHYFMASSGEDIIFNIHHNLCRNAVYVVVITTLHGLFENLRCMFPRILLL